eukprot:TRINITY_DN20277_c0_g1_i3.p1 TRINITY_DN20277_c0_g1~~TRINITY_DN20277_c0_g1_i3.p1  ORF type:complete len:149 (+),score=23.68 TRINITY_DN20277_c0_g1_i3:82-528(+)
MYIIVLVFAVFFFFFQAEDGIRDAQESRGLGDVYKRQFVHRRVLSVAGMLRKIPPYQLSMPRARRPPALTAVSLEVRILTTNPLAPGNKNSSLHNNNKNISLMSKSPPLQPVSPTSTIINRLPKPSSSMPMFQIAPLLEMSVPVLPLL